MATLMWPDTALPNKLIVSCEFFDDVEPARNLQQLPPEVIVQSVNDACSGTPTRRHTERLEASKRGHANAADILKGTLKEQQHGPIGRLGDRQRFHRMYGRGQWRPFPTQVVYRKGKYRPIDDGRTGGHNAAAGLGISIITQRGTWLLSLVKSCGCRIAERSVVMCRMTCAGRADCKPMFTILSTGVRFKKELPPCHEITDHGGLGRCEHQT